jgi:hypothetical protein
MIENKIREIQAKYWPPTYQSDDEYNFEQSIKQLAELFEWNYNKLINTIDRTWIDVVEKRDKEIAELQNRLRFEEERIAELQKSLLLYEKKVGDAFVDKSP